MMQIFDDIEKIAKEDAKELRGVEEEAARLRAEEAAIGKAEEAALASGAYAAKTRDQIFQRNDYRDKHGKEFTKEEFEENTYKNVLKKNKEQIEKLHSGKEKPKEEADVNEKPKEEADVNEKPKEKADVNEKQSVFGRLFKNKSKKSDEPLQDLPNKKHSKLGKKIRKRLGISTNKFADKMRNAEKLSDEKAFKDTNLTIEEKEDGKGFVYKTDSETNLEKYIVNKQRLVDQKHRTIEEDKDYDTLSPENKQNLKADRSLIGFPQSASLSSQMDDVTAVSSAMEETGFLPDAKETQHSVVNTNPEAKKAIDGFAAASKGTPARAAALREKYRQQKDNKVTDQGMRL